MRTWETALERFLARWRRRRDVAAALAAGSYVTGGADSHSDVDVVIVLDESIRWRERGDRVVDGLLIEYFANPPRQIRAYFRSDHRRGRQTTATMLATGRALFDTRGTLAGLVREARRWLARPLPRMRKAEIEVQKYGLWDMLDNLEAASEAGSEALPYLYHNVLSRLLATYGGFLRYPAPGLARTHAVLTSANQRRKYLLDAFPDRAFGRCFVRAMTETRAEKMLDHARKLCGHAHRAMGGFDIDGWKVRTRAVEPSSIRRRRSASEARP